MNETNNTDRVKTEASGRSAGRRERRTIAYFSTSMSARNSSASTLPLQSLSIILNSTRNSSGDAAERSMETHNTQHALVTHKYAHTTRVNYVQYAHTSTDIQHNACKHAHPKSTRVQHAKICSVSKRNGGKTKHDFPPLCLKRGARAQHNVRVQTPQKLAHTSSTEAQHTAHSAHTCITHRCTTHSAQRTHIHHPRYLPVGLILETSCSKML